MDITTFFDATAGRGDFAISGGALVSSADMQTAVLISLCTDRRAEEDDALPNQSASRRGWWGDALSQRRIGSRLWLLSREKQLSEVCKKAKEYSEEALSWLFEDGFVSQVLVRTEIVRSGMLGIFIQIEHDQGAATSYRFELAWQQLRSS